MSAAGVIAFAEGWLAIGALVAIAFVIFGLDKVEANAHGGYVFRVLILPGLALLWPIVLWRWRIARHSTEDWRERHSPQRTPAGWLGISMAVAIFLILITAIVARPDQAPPPPERIGAFPSVDLS